MRAALRKRLGRLRREQLRALLRRPEAAADAPAGS
jgi:hypothetical protein